MVKNKKLTECNECGFPMEWTRDLIILDNGIDSMMRVVKDKEYRCPECRFYKDGSTIRKLKPLLRQYLELGKKQLARKLKEEVDKIQHDCASLEICRKDEVIKLIDKLTKDKD